MEEEDVHLGAFDHVFVDGAASDPATVELSEAALSAVAVSPPAAVAVPADEEERKLLQDVVPLTRVQALRNLNGGGTSKSGIRCCGLYVNFLFRYLPKRATTNKARAIVVCSMRKCRALANPDRLPLSSAGLTLPYCLWHHFLSSQCCHDKLRLLERAPASQDATSLPTTTTPRRPGRARSRPVVVLALTLLSFFAL